MTERTPDILSSLSGVRRSGNGWVARCPAHNDRNPSLSIRVTPEGRVLMKCFAGCSFEDIRRAISGPLRINAPHAPEPPRLSRAELEILRRQYRTAMSPERLAGFSNLLGVSVESLARLDAGWDGEALTFPMYVGWQYVSGFRRRLRDGRKLSLKGGREGLFIPAKLTDAGPLILCEGPTSCAAILDFGFDCIGRPSCTGGVQFVCDYLALYPRRDIVIFGDADEEKTRPDGSTFCPGPDGAAALAKRIVEAKLARSVKIVIPPCANDAREWKKQGASRAAVESVIRAANYVRKV